jgi:hypothetical protein
MKIALLILLIIAGASPAMARPHHDDHAGQAAWGGPSTISCETVRAYVIQVGLAQAKAIARANGMTAAQEWRARQCLATKG